MSRYSSHSVFFSNRTLGLGILFLIVLVLPSRAQIGVSPLILEDRVYPGSFRNMSLRISNNGKQALKCQMGVVSMDVIGAGLPIETESAKRSCKDWITLAPASFTLAPNDAKEVYCRVKAPRDAMGGYYAMITCQSEQTESETSDPQAKAAIRLHRQVNAVVMLTVPGNNINPILEPGRPALLPGEHNQGYKIEVPIRNTGNTHARVSGAVQLKSESGKLVDQFPLEAGKGFILPEHERTFSTQREINLPDGVYVAAILIEDRNLHRPMQNTIPFMIKDSKPSLLDPTQKISANLIPEAAGFTVAPSALEAIVRPGTQRIQSIQLNNLTKDAITIKARPLEWNRDNEGIDLVQEQAPAHGRSGSPLVQLRESEFELPPMGSRRVVFNVAVPAGMTGERYAAVCFDRADRQLNASPLNLTRRSARIKIQAQNALNPSARITGLEATRKPNGAYNFRMRLKNDGDCAITPEVSFTVTRTSGDTLGKLTPDRSTAEVLAGGEAAAAVEWTQVLDPGRYSLRVDLRYSPNKPPVSQAGVFTVPAAK